MAPVAASEFAVPAKIVMRGNAKMTLNERFSDISPKSLQNGHHEPVITARLDIGNFGDRAPSRDRFGPVVPTSSFNRRLAHRMSERPHVQAALQSRNKSVRQRLSARTRIGFPPRYSLSELAGDFTTGWSTFNGYSVRARNKFFRPFNNRPFYRARFNFQNRGNFKYGRVQKWRRGGVYRSFRDSRSFQKRQRICKEDLDNEIDAYMAKTKLHLDADMDAYMADTTISSY